MTLPDAGMPEEYTEQEFQQLLAQFEKDKTVLTKNQKAAVARYNVKKGKGETVTWKVPGAAPATLTKEERIALAKAKSQAVKAQAAASGEGAEAKPKGPSPEELAAQKARGFPHIQAIEKRLGKAVKGAIMLTDVPGLVLDTATLRESMAALKNEFGYTYMMNMTAVDYPPDRMELVYHLWNMTEKTYVAVKATVPRADPVAPSVESVWRMADWQEREMYDMFGIRFEGHPYLKRLLLPDAWTGHPLRKDYDVTKEQFIAMDERGNDLVSFKEDEGW
ncbi:MAG TPA: NADH-quinone oxidoreductase subunit C [Candidatus Thermoplasmatota archaeon]|nr:NADH-quinone oxidoreductase subunit C [Candidatus Thermoplasmatota archaeon]